MFDKIWLHLEWNTINFEWNIWWKPNYIVLDA